MQGYEMHSGSCGTELIYIRPRRVQTGREREGRRQTIREGREEEAEEEGERKK